MERYHHVYLIRCFALKEKRRPRSDRPSTRRGSPAATSEGLAGKCQSWSYHRRMNLGYQLLPPDMQNRTDHSRGVQSNTSDGTPSSACYHEILASPHFVNAELAEPRLASNIIKQVISGFTPRHDHRQLRYNGGASVRATTMRLSGGQAPLPASIVAPHTPSDDRSPHGVDQDRDRGSGRCRRETYSPGLSRTRAGETPALAGFMDGLSWSKRSTDLSTVVLELSARWSAFLTTARHGRRPTWQLPLPRSLPCSWSVSPHLAVRRPRLSTMPTGSSLGWNVCQ